MTQAFNLSQFANKVNTSGQADLTTAVTGTLPVANGGTNNNALAVTAGGVLYTDGSKVVNVGAGTSGQALLSSGAGAPVWGSAGATGTLKNIQYFTVAGTSTYTPTSGTTFVIVEVIGGGGGASGARGGSLTTAASSGGFAGGYARKKITSGFSGVTVTVGAGGSGISTQGGGVTAGGTSSFGALVSATGAGTASAGSGSSGDINSLGGSPWYAGGYVTTGGSYQQTIAGSSFLSQGAYNAAGNNGVTGLYGAGGSGAISSGTTSTYTGGSGGTGIVIVYEYA
jgi:hypothetical protein